ncbi:MAG: sugar ABC transporter permease [Eubacteriales bacterium]
MAKKNLFSYLLITPLLLITVVFIIYPLITTVIDSFRSVNLMKPNDIGFIGTGNYTELLNDITNMQTMRNNCLYFVFSIIIETAGGLIVALALKNNFRSRALLLAVIILPWALPPVVNGLIWKLIYYPSSGLLNDLLLKADIIGSPKIWMGMPQYSIFLITIVHAWKIIPLCTLIILAQLQSIDKDLYEAVKIDGANGLQEFRHITLPMLKPALAVSLTLGAIFAFQLFDEIYVLNGTALDTRSVLIQAYLLAFRDLKVSLGMALSLIAMIVTLAITTLINRLGVKHY